MIRTIISKVASVVAASAAQWLPSANPSMQVITILRGLSSQVAGAAVRLSSILAQMLQTSGVALVAQYSGSFNSPQSSGMAQTSVANLGTSPQTGAGKIVNVKWTLAGDYGATGATTAAVTGSTVWATPANATGYHDAVYSTLQATITTASDANITLTYAALANKTAFTIATVSVVFYATQTASTGGVQAISVYYQYSINNGSTWTTLKSYINTSIDDSTGASFDITAAVAGSWATVNSIQTRVYATFAASPTSSTTAAYLDAVELVINGSLTYTP